MSRRDLSFLLASNTVESGPRTTRKQAAVVEEEMAKKKDKHSKGGKKAKKSRQDAKEKEVPPLLQAEMARRDEEWQAKQKAKKSTPLPAKRSKKLDESMPGSSSSSKKTPKAKGVKVIKDKVKDKVKKRSVKGDDESTDEEEILEKIVHMERKRRGKGIKPKPPPKPSKYRALAEESSDEEQEETGLLIRMKNQAPEPIRFSEDEDEPLSPEYEPCELESTDFVSQDEELDEEFGGVEDEATSMWFDREEEGDDDEISVGEEDDRDYDPVIDSAQAEESESADDEDVVEERLPRAAAKKRGRGKQRRDPQSDNDPDIDDDDTPDYADDELGWSRNNHHVSKRRFAGPGPRGPTQDPDIVKSPLDFFFSFFPLFLLTRIAQWTNVVLKKKKIKVTSMKEVRAWLGVRLVMACVRLNNYRNYWSTKPGWNNLLISRTMSRSRFEELSGNLQFADPAKSPNLWPRTTVKEKQKYFMHVRKNPIYMIQVIWDTVLENCKKNFNLGRKLAFDEAMVSYRGAKSTVRRVFMPAKPVKMGFKIYALCESASHYLHSFAHMSNEKTTMVDQVCKLMEPLKHRYHQVFTDRAYTSVALARRLNVTKTYLTGTVKLSSKNLPADFGTRTRAKSTKPHLVSEMKFTPRGTQYYRQNGKLTVALWKDTQVLAILSSCHEAFRDKQRDFVQRKFKAPGDQRSGLHQVPCPTQVVEYNQNYGGVDKHDQLRSYFTADRKSHHWWFHLIYFLFDIACANAYICYNFHNKRNHSKFTMQLAEDLIDGYVETGHYRRQEYRTQITPIPHKFVTMPINKPRACVGCLKQKKKSKGGTGVRERRTKFGCMACNQHYCGDCFTSIHPDQQAPPTVAPQNEPPAPRPTKKSKKRARRESTSASSVDSSS